MTVISKTTFTFTVLHMTDEQIESIDDALYVAEVGHAVGATTAVTIEEVPDSNVSQELKRLGNDGSFFDYDLGYCEHGLFISGGVGACPVCSET